MNIAVIGLGPVGLAAFRYLKHRNLDVDGYDKSDSVRDNIKRSYEYDIKHIDKYDKPYNVNIICVGTWQEGDTTRLDNITDVLDKIAKPNAHTNIIIKSTLPLGLTRKLAIAYPWFNFIYNPAFNPENELFDEWFNPTKTVIGTPTGRITDSIYSTFSLIFRHARNEIITDYETAELIKYANNAYLSTRIAFINSIAAIAKETNANIDTIEFALTKDPRFGKRVFSELEHGGTCLPKDFKQLIDSAKQLGLIEKEEHNATPYVS